MSETYAVLADETTKGYVGFRVGPDEVGRLAILRVMSRDYRDVMLWTNDPPAGGTALRPEVGVKGSRRELAREIAAYIEETVAKGGLLISQSADIAVIRSVIRSQGEAGDDFVPSGASVPSLVDKYPEWF